MATKPATQRALIADLRARLQMTERDRDAYKYQMEMANKALGELKYNCKREARDAHTKLVLSVAQMNSAIAQSYGEVVGLG